MIQLISWNILQLYQTYFKNRSKMVGDKIVLYFNFNVMYDSFHFLQSLLLWNWRSRKQNLYINYFFCHEIDRFFHKYLKCKQNKSSNIRYSLSELIDFIHYLKTGLRIYTEEKGQSTYERLVKGTKYSLS